MENRRQKSTSGDTFSFPSTPIHEQDSDFEFGCFTPDSASSTDPCKDSPADHLFFNGRLLPHAFPFQPISNGFMGVDSNSRRTSRMSSISSKDSIMSSRSNSTNSRSSSCSSSARTSSSDLAVPVPASLSRDNSRKKAKVDQLEGKEKPIKGKRKGRVKTVVVRRSFGRRFFRWLVWTCRKCHAMEPSNKSIDYVIH
ncbi:PREDICTED: probable membrane-associated kinase regulator [Prunus dulcis]|uniref:PREDICTED: probable membrane-associated kinase regulator n=1 Tax=Prunus dulcis TaxID=3755 RepID=A0A5E4ENL9_PRUDU|nr:PREDICTED: probable membrane-associated kinase regulator [Prunus dulcis]